MGGQVEIRRGFDAVLLDLESDVLAEAFEIVALLVIAFDGGLLKTVFPRGVLKNLTEQIVVVMNRLIRSGFRIRIFKGSGFIGIVQFPEILDLPAQFGGVLRDRSGPADQSAGGDL